MVDDNELERLGRIKAPEPGAEARARALHAAMQAFDNENNSTAPQGSAEGLRLTHQIGKLWRETMQKKLLAAPALAGLVALPIAGYATFYLMEESPFRFQAGQGAADQPARQDQDEVECRTEEGCRRTGTRRAVRTRRPARRGARTGSGCCASPQRGRCQRRLRDACVACRGKPRPRCLRAGHGRQRRS